MNLRHLVVACDKTEAARAAQAAAVDIAGRVHARVSVIYVATAVLQRPVEVSMEAIPPVPDRDGLAEEFDNLCLWWRSGPRGADCGGADVPVACMVGLGLPSVEITRYAEDHQADLIVMTRKRHSQLRRMLLGDTADSVVRRSPVPCLFVPPDGFDESPILVAADGTERGLAVVHAGIAFAQAIGGDVSFVTVEPPHDDEPSHLTKRLPGERSVVLARALDQFALHGERHGRLDPKSSAAERLTVRRGSPVPEILQELSDTQAGVLVVGYHRGGPPGPLESRSVARQLTHRAPCAVLTVPL
ncbi:MAG: universal stress protein [Gemmatimonadales bacterium]|nr:MAG: universal stress protein [Gemmatimonadales bacterium]